MRLMADFLFGTDQIIPFENELRKAERWAQCALSLNMEWRNLALEQFKIN